MSNTQVRQQLLLKWSINPQRMWIPLIGSIIADTVYFNFKEFNEEFGLSNLRKLVAGITSEPLFMISEIGEDHKAGYQSMKTYEELGNLEMYYCDEQANWVIYISHEDTIALAGKLLIRTLKEQWLNFDLYVNPWPGIN